MDYLVLIIGWSLEHDLPIWAFAIFCLWIGAGQVMKWIGGSNGKGD